MGLPVEEIDIGQYVKHDLHPLFGIPTDEEDGTAVGVS